MQSEFNCHYPIQKTARIKHSSVFITYQFVWPPCGNI